jgi:hypothetical protein
MQMVDLMGLGMPVEETAMDFEVEIYIVHGLMQVHYFYMTMVYCRIY